jgi:hypothetical protein
MFIKNHLFRIILDISFFSKIMFPQSQETLRSWVYLGKGIIKLNNFGNDSDLKTTIKYSSDYENPDWNKIRD